MELFSIKIRCTFQLVSTVKDTVQCRDRFAELDYQRLIGRVHSLSSFPFFAFSHLSRAARHSSNVGLTQENNSLSMGWR